MKNFMRKWAYPIGMIPAALIWNVGLALAGVEPTTFTLAVATALLVIQFTGLGYMIYFVRTE